MSNELKPSEQAQVLAEQVKAWTAERDRLNDLIAHATGAVSDQVVGEPCAHNRQSTTALGAITGTGWKCSDCGALLSKQDAPDRAAPVSDDELPLPSADLTADDGTGRAIDAWSSGSVLKARRDYHAHMLRKMGGPVAWIATDLDGHGDVAWTKEEAKRRAGEYCTEFVPLYDIGDAKLAQARAAGAERDGVDAARYRWLRKGTHDIYITPGPDEGNPCPGIMGEIADRAIDRAMLAAAPSADDQKGGAA